MKSILLIFILFFTSCLAQSCYSSNGFYFTSVAPSTTSGGIAVFYGCFLSNQSMSLTIGNEECTFINQTDFEYTCYAQPGYGIKNVYVLIDDVTRYTAINFYIYIDNSQSNYTSTTNEISTTSGDPSSTQITTTYTTTDSQTTTFSSGYQSTTTTTSPSITGHPYSSTTGYPSSTTSYSSSTTSYPSSSSSSSPNYQPIFCEYTESGITINSSSLIECNGYGQTFCVDNLGGSTCQSDSNVKCTVKSNVDYSSMTCYGNHIQCFSLYARCSVNLLNNQFHVNGELQTSNLVEISDSNETRELELLNSPSSSSSSLIASTFSIFIFVIISVL
ncbi:hypothetical protein ACTA71_006300 [Dictyostelium dimigraforme]